MSSDYLVDIIRENAILRAENARLIDLVAERLCDEIAGKGAWESLTHCDDIDCTCHDTMRDYRDLVRGMLNDD